MDSFFAQADDLDKMLDDFEREETHGNSHITSIDPKTKEQHYPNQTINQNINQTTQNGIAATNNFYNMDKYGEHRTPVDLIDLSEADFAPDPQTSLPYLATGGPPSQTAEGGGADNGGDAVFTQSVPADSQDQGRARSDSNTMLADQDFSSFLPTNLPDSVSLENLQRMNSATHANENQVNNSVRQQIPQGVDFHPVRNMDSTPHSALNQASAQNSVAGSSLVPGQIHNTSTLMNSTPQLSNVTEHDHVIHDLRTNSGVQSVIGYSNDTDRESLQMPTSNITQDYSSVNSQHDTTQKPPESLYVLPMTTTTTTQLPIEHSSNMDLMPVNPTNPVISSPSSQEMQTDTSQTTMSQSEVASNSVMVQQTASPVMATMLQEGSANIVESPNMASLKPTESPNMATLLAEGSPNMASVPNMALAQQVETPNMATAPNMAPAQPVETPNMATETSDIATLTPTTEPGISLTSGGEPQRPIGSLQGLDTLSSNSRPVEPSQLSSQPEVSSSMAVESSMEVEHSDHFVQPHRDVSSSQLGGMSDTDLTATEEVPQPVTAPVVESSQPSTFSTLPTAISQHDTTIPNIGVPPQESSIQDGVTLTPSRKDCTQEDGMNHMDGALMETSQYATENHPGQVPVTQPPAAVGFGNLDNLEMSQDEMDAFLNSAEDALPTVNSSEMNGQHALPSQNTMQQDGKGSISDVGIVLDTPYTMTTEQTLNPANLINPNQMNSTQGVNNLIAQPELQNSNFVHHPVSNPAMQHGNPSNPTIPQGNQSIPHGNLSNPAIPHGNSNPSISNTDPSVNNPNPGDRNLGSVNPQPEWSMQSGSTAAQDNASNDLMHDSAACAIQGLSLATAATTQSLLETTSTDQEITKPSDVENLRRKQLQQSPTKEVPSGGSIADDAAMAEAMAPSQSITSKQSVMRQSLHLDFNHPSQRRVQLDNQQPPPATTQSMNDESDGPVGQDSEMMEHSVNEEESSESLPSMPLPVSVPAEPSLNVNESVPSPSRFNLDLPEGAYQLGSSAPIWVPDLEAPNCMMCATKFTFTKRRHHCRACGKVFCSNCCNTKAKLQYMGNKEARVCVSCNNIMQRVEAIKAMNSPGGPGRPNPNNPSEYCSTVPPLEQARHNVDQPPPSVMVPRSKSVLRRPNSEGSQRQREPRHVRFSDGIHPGGDLTEDSPSAVSIRPPRTSRRVRSRNSDSSRVGSAKRHEANFPVSLIPKDESKLPPVVINTGVKGEYTLEENPNQEELMTKLRSDSVEPVVFVLNKNLFVLVNIINLDCCVNRVCWCFTTKGMPIVGQDEIVIVLECLPQEKTVPRDIFCHFNTLYEEACRNNTVTEMGNTIFAQNFLGSREHGGFLYVRPSFQCLRKLLLPEPPYLFGVLLQKWETPWAKLFPIRLMLRLGAEYRYYPCPLMSVRFRKPVYGEIGHTIMNLLADFKNYQYMLPRINGVVIHMEDKQTSINFPKNRYDDIMKVLNNSNEHVMAMASNFSNAADSHLVCIQNDDGHYQTQAINIQNKPRKVTGASFVVFNGALKTSSGLMAKSSIVEDGLMVQIPPDSMTALRHAMRQMTDFTISCGAIGSDHPEETVTVQWIGDDNKINVGVVSPIDGKSMEGITSLRIQNGTDYMGENRTIRWTEVFFLQNEESVGQRCDAVDLTRLAETLAQGCCIAMTPCLDGLKEMNMSKIALRVTIGTDRVGYEIGSNGKILPAKFMKDLDNQLIPVITNAVTQQDDGPITLELIFYVLD